MTTKDKLRYVLEKKMGFTIFMEEHYDDNSFMGFRVESKSKIRYLVTWSETFRSVVVERMEPPMLTSSTNECNLKKKINKLLREKID